MQLRSILIGTLLFGITQATAQLQLPVLPEDHAGGCSRKSSLSKGLPVSPGAFADNRIDVTYYKLDMTMDIPASRVAGTVTVKATSLVDSLREFTLDLSGAMTVDSVTVEGQAVSFSRFAEGIGIPLNPARSPGNTFTAEVSYHGVPRVTGLGSYVFSSHGGTPWVWSLSEPYGAREWWPCKDHPLDKADSADIWIRCPSWVVVGSNGTLREVVDNGDGTSSWKWSERYPIATYLVSIALTNFVQFSNWFHYSPTDSMEILNMVLPEHEAAARAALPGTVRMMEIFSNLYGLYPFIEEKYGHAEFGWGGAMEHQTMTSTTTFAELTLAHELAHQWFGDLITCATWQDLWLNEGFATYGEALYREQQYGSADYANHMRGEMSLARSAPGPLFVEDTSDVRNLFDNTRVYAKGASVLHMLRHVLGDSLFFMSLRSYADDPRFRYATASTRDFQDVCETSTGRQLGYFFDQWVFGENHPVYEARWESEPVDGAHQVVVTLTQFTRTQNPEFFTMPVDLRFSSDTRDTTITVFHTESGQQFSIRLPFEPRALEVDPDEWILKEISSPIPGLPSSFKLEQNFPNPFNAGTAISFHLPSRGTIRLEVFDIMGRRVATLADGQW
ncbi:MAG: M1 family metallopeptidase, partial [Bacteroidota bacterium]